MNAQKWMCLLLFWGGLSLPMHGQLIKSNGFIVPRSGDTTYGKIWTGDAQTACQKVVFEDQAGITQTYDPTEVLSYGYGKDQVYLSAQVHRTDEDGLLVAMTQPVFLRRLRSGEIHVYELDHEEGRSLYVGKSPDELQLMHYGLVLVPQEDVSLGVIRLQDGTVFTNLTPHMVVQDEQGRRFKFTKARLHQIVPQYQFDLMSVLPEGQPALDPKFPLNKPKIIKTLEEHYEITSWNVRPRFQIEASAFWQAIPIGLPAQPENLVGERGFMLEIRNNRLSPKFSVRLAYSNLNWESYRGDIVEPSRLIMHEMEVVTLGINYHFRAGQKFRPFITSGGHLLQYRSSSFFFDPNDIIRAGIGAGADYYPIPLLKVRAEIGYKGYVYAGGSVGLWFGR